MKKTKKILFISAGSIFIFVVIVIIFISPITKYLIEKYSVKYTGREITLDWAYVNPFTGYIHLNDLKIHESKSDSIFFSANGISVNFALLKLFSKTYEISSLTLDHPIASVIQGKNYFNFDDLIEKFSPKDSVPKPAKPPLHFNLLDVKIKEGTFYYHEKQVPINYFIKKLNLESDGMRWNVDTIATKFSFSSGIGNGDIKGEFVMNIKSNDYSTHTVINKFDLNIIEQYLKDLTNYGTFSANLDANIIAKGNFKDQEKLTSSGVIAVNDFHFGKNRKEDYASFSKLTVAIKEVSPNKHVYSFDSISLSHPYFKYEKYDSLDNIQTIFGEKGSNVKAVNADATKFNLVIELAKYIKTISKNFFDSPYKINRLGVYKADLRYNDYSLSEEFSAGLNPLTFTADSINKNRKRVELFLNSGIIPYGNLSVAISINPKDSTNFDLHVSLVKIPITLFNPFIVSYTSFPLDRGTIEFNSIWNVRNGIIQSKNHLLILDPRVTKRVRNKDNKWIPTPLIMAFVRERGNVINYEIPITGDLKKPKFHLSDVILDLVKNIFVKPVTTPYGIEVKNIETKIEKSLTIKWDMRSNALGSIQEKFLGKISDFLAKNPEATIEVYPEQYETKEKESILFFETKKKYFLLTHNKEAGSFSPGDSELVDRMSIKDLSLVHYLNKHSKNSLAFTIQEKCSNIIDVSIVDTKFKKLNKEREDMFLSFFKSNHLEQQVKFCHEKDIVPFNGFSFYKIMYKGEFPESLIKAYQKMNELDEEAPRKKFEKERRKYASNL
jgi:hypothetical protein